MEYRTEHEQVEELKEWWQKNGKNVITTIVVVLAVVAAVRFWFGYQASTRENASAAYEQLMQQMQQNDTEGALKTGSRIIEEYSGTAYAALAAMSMARMDVDSGEFDSAERRLRWALDHAGDDLSLEHIARLRLGRLLLQQQRPGEVIELLDVNDVGAFAGAYAALRGDAYKAQGQVDNAANAYNAALNDPTTSAEQRELLQLKLDNLSATVVAPTAAAAEEAP